MTEQEELLQEELSKCKFLKDYLKLLDTDENFDGTGYKEALGLIATANDAYELAWTVWDRPYNTSEAMVIESLHRFLDMAVDERVNENYFGFNEDRHAIFFYPVVFSDASLVKKTAEFFGTELG